MKSQEEKALTFRALHQREGAFVIPNPWDAGSAKLLAGLGFEALATTSSGFAHTLGRFDGEVTRDEKLEHCRLMAEASDLPISADLENGFGHSPEEAAETVLLAAKAGTVGGSLEDFSGSTEDPIYEISHAVDRVRAAVEALRSLSFPFTLTARAENFLHRRRDLGDTIRRLQAFEEAGADVLYAPGLSTLEEVREVCRSVGKPVNVLAPMVRGATVDDLAAAGAKRLSVGGLLSHASLSPVLEAAREMLEDGSFTWTAKITRGKEIRELFAKASRDG